MVEVFIRRYVPMKQIDNLKKQADKDNNVSEQGSHTGKTAVKLTDDMLNLVAGGGRTEESWNDPSQDDWYTEDGNGWTISPG